MTEAHPSHHLSSFSPLRYPGGKGKLANYVKAIIGINRLSDGVYVEPYAGGAAIACELLLQEYVSKVFINDICTHVWAFWHSVLHDTDKLVQQIRDTKLSVSTWDRQKRVFCHPDDHDTLQLGFATFFLNRTNRSGIFNGGVIGGRTQTGKWKIDARFNKAELVRRIEAIAKMRSRVTLSRLDAAHFLREGFLEWPKKTLIYLDPPYYVKGKDLYLNSYDDSNHREIANILGRRVRQSWVVSYDDVAQIRRLYAQQRFVQYSLAYSAREARDGKEIMFFCDSLAIPPPTPSMKEAKTVLTVRNTGVKHPSRQKREQAGRSGSGKQMQKRLACPRF